MAVDSQSNVIICPHCARNCINMRTIVAEVQLFRAKPVNKSVSISIFEDYIVTRKSNVDFLVITYWFTKLVKTISFKTIPVAKGARQFHPR